jgi:hypothetical protein
MDTDTVSIIEHSSTLHNHITENRIIGIIVKELLEIPEIKTLKMSLDLLLHVALLLENLCYDNNLTGKPKGYKADMCIKVFEKLGFATSADDKAFIINGLNFLHTAGKIKRVGWFKRFFTKIYKMCIKRL